jgi:hypothetical protein
MKLLHNTVALVSLTLVAVGLFWLYRLGLLGSGLSICILALISAPVLSMGCYALHLCDRINALEKRLRELEQ